MTEMWTWARLRKLWRFLLIILTPIVLLPIFFLDGQQNIQSNKFKCAYVISVMVVFWILQLLPLAVTSCIPVVLFPFFGIQNTGAVVANYMKESSMTFIGGMSLALGIQYSGLHRRIALKIILTIGSSPGRILLGILVTTMSLSCIVVTNAGVTAMMISVANGVIEAFEDKQSKVKLKELKKLYYLAVGYASNIGGTAIITGSQASLIYKDLIEKENIGQNGKFTELNFATFTAYSLPIAVINLFLAWIILSLMYLGCPKFYSNKRRSLTPSADVISNETTSQNTLRQNSSEHVAQLLRKKLHDLGRTSFHEWSIIVIITVTVILWLSKEPQVFSGWFSLFPDGHPKIGESVIAVAALIIMFIVPKDISYFRGDLNGKADTVLNWDYIHKHLPWQVLFIAGGSLAISDGATVTGLSAWLGDQLNALENFSRPVMLIVIVVLISLLTEMISNVAVVSLLTPILFALSKRLNLHPLHLSLPAAVVSQFAFMLPTASPTNAIVFAAGDMNIIDKAKPGVFVNFASVAVLYLMNVSWGEYIFKYSSYEYEKTMN